MLRVAVLFFLFLNFNLFCQHSKEFDIAYSLFQSKQYSSAQLLFNKIKDNGGSNQYVDYYHAKCSKELFLDDAIILYDQYIDEYPATLLIDEVNEDIASIYYRNKEYSQAISYIEKIPHPNTYLIFKLAYANFCIESYVESSYYFHKIINIKSKYSSTSRYYYAYICYKQEKYKTAIDHFIRLVNDKEFGSIVPYYIAQIYFLQEEYQQLISFAEPMVDNVIPSRISEMNRFLAESYYRIRDYDNAIIYFNKFLATEDNPSSIVYFSLGQSYYETFDYKKSIEQFENVSSNVDSIMQYTSYYLGASYLKTEHYNYALQAFKKASSFEYNSVIQEEAYFNYAKLSYELDLPFDNTLKIMEYYLETFNNLSHSQEIEELMIEALQSTSNYLEAYSVLSAISSPTYDQKKLIQQLTFFLGVQAYNLRDYKKAISYFSDSDNYKINSDFSYLANFWLADSYFQLSNPNKAAEIYSALTKPVNDKLEYYDVLQKYNLAYCYFLQSEYILSNKFFRIYETLSNDSMYLNDTYLRIADGYFMQKEYYLAEQYYAKAIDYNLFDTDYSIYNRSVCLGLIGSHIIQVKLLKELLDDYKTSVFYDDALVDLANFYQNSQEYNLSLDCYDELLLISKDEQLIASSTLNKGIIYLNTNKIDKAIDEFLSVIENYSHTKYFKEALSGLQSAYVNIGRVDDYIALIDSLPAISISVSEQDTLIYNTAFIKFSEQDYISAQEMFLKYLKRFPAGAFVFEAAYHGATSSIEIKDTVNAIELYTVLLNANDISYYESALIFLARTYYRNRDFILADQYYEKLASVASSNSLKRESIIRLMYLNETTNKDKSVEYAKQVIDLDKMDNWLLSRAHVIIARHEFNIGNYSKSKVLFNNILDISEYDEAAESKYYLAYFAFLDDSLLLAENIIFELVEKYSNDFFIAKGFLLLSDIYLARGNTFQAKATLESIIENYDGEDLVNVARKKWERIIEDEIYIDKSLDNLFYIEILDDEIDYEDDLEEYDVLIIDEDYEVVISDSIQSVKDSLRINKNDLFYENE